MKVLVTIKETIDYQVKVQLNATNTAVNTNGVQMSMNPFDAIAAEAAISLQEKNLITHSTALHIGNDPKVLQQALAMGIDEGVLIKHDTQDTFTKCQVIAEYVKANDFDLIIMGKLAIDGDHGQIPQMLAGMLHYPCATYASDIQVSDKDITVQREVDQGIETVILPTPCIISTDLRLNEPRFIALPKLLAAKSKPITEISSSIKTSSPIKVEKYAYPKKRPGCTPTDDIDTFVQQLIDGGIIK